jgi:hypothetical protein
MVVLADRNSIMMATIGLVVVIFALAWAVALVRASREDRRRRERPLITPPPAPRGDPPPPPALRE